MSTYNVKCILINSVEQKVEYVYRDITITESSQDYLDLSHLDLIRLDDSKLEYYIHYDHAGNSMFGRQTPKDSGFLWVKSDYNKEPEEIDDFSNHIIEGYGNGLIVAYKKSRKRFGRENPVDIDLSLEWAQKRLAEFTNGYNRQVPEFTCMLSPKFDEPNEYELLLRVENKDRLTWMYEVNFDQPIKLLTPQMLTFSIEHKEITIMIGKVNDLDHQTRVMIIRNDLANLSQIASITIVAHKAPAWIKSRLEGFFRKEFFENELNKKESHLSLV